MFAAAREARGIPEHILLFEAFGDFDGYDRGPAFGQRPGLVDDEGVDLLHPFKRLGIFDQHAGFGATPHADHDRHRRREAERAGARSEEHTSELQSLMRISYAVFCLKKKKITISRDHVTNILYTQHKRIP